jgi:hypothetical protein
MTFGTCVKSPAALAHCAVAGTIYALLRYTSSLYMQAEVDFEIRLPAVPE